MQRVQAVLHIYLNSLQAKSYNWMINAEKMLKAYSVHLMKWNSHIGPPDCAISSNGAADSDD